MPRPETGTGSGPATAPFTFLPLPRILFYTHDILTIAPSSPKAWTLTESDYMEGERETKIKKNNLT